MQERDTCSNLKDVSDDDNEDESNEEERDDKNDDKGNDRNDDRGDDRNDMDNDKKDDMDVDSQKDEKRKKRKEIKRKIITNMTRNKGKKYQTQPETASAMVTKYLLDKKASKVQITPPTQQPNATDMFFSSIAATVKNFSPYYQNIAKSQIFIFHCY